MSVFFLCSPRRVVVSSVLQAAFAHSGLTVPLYDTLGPETVEFVVNQTGLTTVVCAGVVELKKLVAIAVGRRCPSLQVLLLCCCVLLCNQRDLRRPFQNFWGGISKYRGYVPSGF